MPWRSRLIASIRSSRSVERLVCCVCTSLSSSSARRLTAPSRSRSRRSRSSRASISATSGRSAPGLTLGQLGDRRAARTSSISRISWRCRATLRLAPSKRSSARAASSRAGRSPPARRARHDQPRPAHSRPRPDGRRRCARSLRRPRSRRSALALLRETVRRSASLSARSSASLAPPSSVAICARGAVAALVPGVALGHDRLQPALRAARPRARAPAPRRAASASCGAIAAPPRCARRASSASDLGRGGKRGERRSASAAPPWPRRGSPSAEPGASSSADSRAAIAAGFALAAGMPVARRSSFALRVAPVRRLACRASAAAAAVRSAGCRLGALAHRRPARARLAASTSISASRFFPASRRAAPVGALAATVKPSQRHRSPSLETSRWPGLSSGASRPHPSPRDHADLREPSRELGRACTMLASGSTPSRQGRIAGPIAGAAQRIGAEASTGLRDRRPAPRRAPPHSPSRP